MSEIKAASAINPTTNLHEIVIGPLSLDFAIHLESDKKNNFHVMQNSAVTVDTTFAEKRIVNYAVQETVGGSTVTKNYTLDNKTGKYMNGNEEYIPPTPLPAGVTTTVAEVYSELPLNGPSRFSSTDKFNDSFTVDVQYGVLLPVYVTVIGAYPFNFYIATLLTSDYYIKGNPLD